MASSPSAVRRKLTKLTRERRIAQLLKGWHIDFPLERNLIFRLNWNGHGLN